jgi:predicted dehydrogenase
VNIAFVGCGNIATHYAKRIAETDGLELVAATDAVPGRADAFVEEHGGTSYRTLDELLADDSVDLVVNLTAPQSHAAVSAAALEAGKHVHSEKPLALTNSDAQMLVELANARGLRLSSAPTTLLGEAQQTVWKIVRDGAIGRVRVAYAESNWGRIEEWHPAPESLYAVGPMVDVGVYPITILTAMFGRARRVVAHTATVEPNRTRLDGHAFTPGAPDFVVAVVELADDVVVRLTATFYVGATKQRGIELHGDAGSLYMPTWGEADSNVEQQPRGGEYELVPPLREPYHGIDWSRALTDLSEAIAEGRPHRMGAEHAAHVVEILCAIEESAASGKPVDLHSEFPRPEPMDWAR